MSTDKPPAGAVRGLVERAVVAALPSRGVAAVLGRRDAGAAHLAGPAHDVRNARVLASGIAMLQATSFGSFDKSDGELS